MESDSDDSVSSYYSALDTNPMDASICAPMASHELESLERKLGQIIFIQQTDATYHKALRDMRDQNSLSLLVEPSFYGRYQTTSVLAVATSNKTYIFDVRALGTIFKELAAILEAERPRKVVHYSHRIADHLHHRYTIKLGGVCDSFVVLCVARQEKSPCSLPEAISLVFGLPLQELLCEEVTGGSESRRNFSARPLTQSQIRYLARMAILQHRMHDHLHLMYGNICSELQGMSLAFSQNYTHLEKSIDLAVNMAPASLFGFGSIDLLPTAKEIDDHEMKHRK
ncbi:protein Exd1 homolog [Drosophila kikkawai]|uniref:Protein Exd1 homolog n=1 Tax=Drosophila kikkawai TaxID=30033 RepID=A0A6P4I1I3_DROKI|nr:protein Exd1 homolog [Drosophila kikkawai]